MDETGIEKCDFQVGELNLIDVSSEDHCLLFSPLIQPISNNFSENQNRDLELLDNMHERDEETNVCSLEEKEQVLQLRESPQVEKTAKGGKYNLRKSLAWDNAFFTSAGFLDAEELSNMIEGKEKTNKTALPVIEEDLRRSTDSISTLASDSLTVESTTETSLFEDIRASIQRSNNASFNNKNLSGVTHGTTTSSSSRIDFISRNKIKSKVAPKKPSGGTQGSGRIVKQISAPPHVLKVAARGEYTSSVCKPLMTRGNPIPTTSTKRASLDVRSVKMDRGSKTSPAVASTRSPVLKTPALTTTQNNPLKHTKLLKSSIHTSTVVTKELATSSSLGSCGSSSSDILRKSSLNLINKKNVTRLVNPPCTGSTARTLPRVASRNKTQPHNTQLSTRLTTVGKLSQNTSPASSMSEWSSDSSSTSAYRRAPSSTTSLETSSCGRVSLDSSSQVSDSHSLCNDQFFVGNGVQPIESLGDNRKRVSTETSGLVNRPAVKPSGLRMPSPKIGFFDGARTLTRTPNANMHSHPRVSGGLPKHGTASPSSRGGSSITKPGKTQPSGTPKAIFGTKLDVHHNTPKVKLASRLSHHESSNSAKKTPTPTRNINCVVGSFVEDQNQMPLNTLGENLLESEEYKSQGGTRTLSHQIEEKSDYSTHLENNASPQKINIKSHAVNEEFHAADYSSSLSVVDNISSSPKVAEDGNQGHKTHIDSQAEKLSIEVKNIDINHGSREDTE